MQRKGRNSTNARGHSNQRRRETRTRGLRQVGQITCRFPVHRPRNVGRPAARRSYTKPASEKRLSGRALRLPRSIHRTTRSRRVHPNPSIFRFLREICARVGNSDDEAFCPSELQRENHRGPPRNTSVTGVQPRPPASKVVHCGTRRRRSPASTAMQLGSGLGLAVLELTLAFAVWSYPGESCAAGRATQPGPAGILTVAIS